MTKMSNSLSRSTESSAQKCGARIPSAFLEVVRLLAGVPIRKNSSGWQFSVFSWQFVLCVFIYVVMVPVHWSVLNDAYKLFQAVEEDSTDYLNHQIFFELFITLMIPSVIIPFTTWLESSSIAAYFNRCNAFLDMFATTTGRRLQFTLKTKLLLSYGAFNIVSQNIIVQAAPPYLDFWKTSVCAINMVSLCTNLSYGVCLTDCLSQAGEAITCCLEHELQAESCDAKNIIRYKQLWLELSHLTTDSSSHVCRTVSIPLMITMFAATISMYGLFASLREPYFAAFYVVCVFLCTTPLFLVCNNAYATMAKVRDPTMKILTTVRRSQVNSSSWQAVRSFLETIDESPPVVSLGGYAVINRKLLHSAGTTISTYLVVILQFRMSLQANAETTGNGTFDMETTEKQLLA